MIAVNFSHWGSTFTARADDSGVIEIVHRAKWGDSFVGFAHMMATYGPKEDCEDCHGTGERERDCGPLVCYCVYDES